jgi:hypothetical protein
VLLLGCSSRYLSLSWIASHPLSPPPNWTHRLDSFRQTISEQVPFAYKIYTREDEVGWHESCAFRNTFSTKVHVDFLGVWCFPSINTRVFVPVPLTISFILRDTVNSVGLFPHRLPFTAANTGIRVYRHAVSLDERRASFKASLTPDTGGPEKRRPLT